MAVEVKLRRTVRAGGPEEAVDPRRVVRLREDAGRLRRSAAPHAATTLRIDLVSFTPAGAAWRVARWPAIDQW